MKSVNPLIIVLIVIKWLFTSIEVNAAYLPTIAWGNVTSKPTFATVATSGDYDDLSDKPTIPNNTNQLINGSGFLTSAATSVGITSSDLSVSGTPITSSGNITVNINSSLKTNWDSAYTYRAKFYNSAGRLFIVPKIWMGVVNITDATQQSVDISSSGFTTVAFIGVSVIDDLPTDVIVRSNTTTAVVLDSYQLISTGVSILSIPVIQTVSMGVATNLTGLQCCVTVFGY